MNKHRVLSIAMFLACPMVLFMFCRSVRANSVRPNNIKVEQHVNSKECFTKYSNQPKLQCAMNNSNKQNMNNNAGNSYPNLTYDNLSVNRMRLGGMFHNIRYGYDNKIGLIRRAPKISRANVNQFSLRNEYNIQNVIHDSKDMLTIMPMHNRVISRLASIIKSTHTTKHYDHFANVAREGAAVADAIGASAGVGASIGADMYDGGSTSGLTDMSLAATSAAIVHAGEVIGNSKHVIRLNNRYANLWRFPWGNIYLIHHRAHLNMSIAPALLIDGNLLRQSSGNILIKLMTLGIIKNSVRDFDNGVLSEIFSFGHASKNLSYLIDLNTMNRASKHNFKLKLNNILHIKNRSKFPSYPRWLRLMTVHASRHSHSLNLNEMARIIARRIRAREAREIQREYHRELRHHSHASYHRIRKSVINNMHKTTHKHLISATYKQGELDAENDLDSGRDQDSVNLILSHNMMSNPEYVIGFSHYLSDNGNSGSNGDALLNELTAYQQMSDNPEVRYGFEECMDYAGASAPGIVQEHDNDSDFHKGWYLATVYLNDGNVNAANSEPFNQNI